MENLKDEDGDDDHDGFNYSNALLNACIFIFNAVTLNIAVIFKENRFFKN